MYYLFHLMYKNKGQHKHLLAESLVKHLIQKLAFMD